ncbi:MAG: redoxin domain-containing protein [Myxococcales bacterium]|nr:redoxin domain-containing protein [Myxococcales bacterium]
MPIALLILACAEDPTTGPGTPAEAPVLRQTMDGLVTWSVDFDAEAEASGLTDCSYTRHYVGVEDRSTPWLCIGCEQIFRASVEMEPGWETCWDTVSTSLPLEEEWFGIGGGTWYRQGVAFGDAETDGDSFSVSVTTDPDPADVGSMVFDISGSATTGEEEGDPLGGWVPAESYTCGWPKADPPAYTGDYTARIGGTLPDGVFDDVCKEPVRLHDFAGRYLIVEISAMDCPPCQAAASEETAFVESMKAEGIEVEVITLLAPSLSDTAGTPTKPQLKQWIDQYDLHSPVLADRVWGLAVVAPAVGDGFGYPSMMVVSPDLEILDTSVGFGGYDGMGDLIRSHASR